MIEKQISIKNIQTNYKIFGKGKPFLILHGWGSKSDKWQKVAELLIQKDIQVIIPDLPGFGKSEEPKTTWSLDNYVEWLKEFSDTIPELKNSFYLLGHSFGGSLAAKFTIKYNQKVEKLFLVAASCIRIATPSKKIIYNFSRIVKIFYFFPYYELFRKYFYKIFLKRSDYPYISGIMKEIYLRVIKEDLSQKLSSLKIPTIILWGGKDDLTPIEHANIIHKKIHNSKLIVIPGANHNLHIHSVEVLAEKILDSMSGELLSLKNII